jgi:serine/threonine protein kinase
MAESGPKIIDFGIAQVSDATSVTSTGLIAGSPAWFSPEQIEGKVLTGATDLFSAGSVLTFAATGESPWGDDPTMTKASVYGILVAEPNLNGASSEQLHIISALLKKDPSERHFPAAISHLAPESRIAAEAPPDGTERKSGLMPSLREGLASHPKIVAALSVATLITFGVVAAQIGAIVGNPSSQVEMNATEGNSSSQVEMNATQDETGEIPRCVPASLRDDFEILESRTGSNSVELSVELVVEPDPCWGGITRVSAAIRDNRVPRFPSNGFYGAPWSPGPCEVGKFEGVRESAYAEGGQAVFVFERDESSERPRYTLSCVSDWGSLDPWPFSIGYGVQFENLSYENRHFVKSELSDYRP